MRAKPSLWREYLGYFRPHAWTLAGVALAGLAQSLAYIPLAALLRRIFDVILPSQHRGELWTAMGGLLALQLGVLVIAYWSRTRALRANHDVLARLRMNSLESLYRLPRSFYTHADLERLHVTLVYDTDRIDFMNNALTAQFLPAGLSALVLFAILLWIDPVYALIIAVTAPAIFVVNRLMTRRIWFQQEGLRRAFESFSRGVRFVLAAIELTRAQAAEPVELKRQSANVEELRRVALHLNRFDAMLQLAQSGLLLAATLAVLVAGGYAQAEGTATRGEMMAFYVVAALFAAQARAMVGAIPEIRMGMRAFRELHRVLAHPGREPYQGTREIASVGEIRLDGVSFSYPDGPCVLDAVTLAIPAGARLALIGANGSGKSSLIYLIAGYYRPVAGSLSAGGIPYDDLNIRKLRTRMAIVPQNPFLFAGTIRANVAYGAEEAGDEAIRQALAWAGADQFVEQTADGLETDIGEQGVRLSGGQRQRLVIARALLRRPDLLILDEPTNHLDEEAIERLMESLHRLPFRPSILVISHEWRVLRHVDRAYRLVDGRLQEVARTASRAHQ